MSIWKMLLIWLTSLAGTGCVGFLMATFLVTGLEGDMAAAERRPPRPPRSTNQAPWRPRWLWYIAYGLFSNAVQYAIKIAPWTLWVLGALLCGMFAFVFIRGAILCRGTQHAAMPWFCFKGAAACAGIAAASGIALWQFN